MDGHIRSMVPAFPVNGKYKYITQNYEVPDISPAHMGDISVEIAVLGFFEDNNPASKPGVEKPIASFIKRMDDRYHRSLHNFSKKRCGNIDK